MKFVTSIFWNFQQHRLRALWRIILQTCLMVMLLIMTALITWIIEPVIPMMWMNELEPYGILIGIGTQLLTVMVGSWLAGRLFDRRPWAAFGFHFSRSWWRDFAFGLALGAILMALIFLVELTAGWVQINALFSPPSTGSFFQGWIIQLFLFVCVGIYEEMLSRGYHLRNFAEGLNFRRVGPRAALLLACLISSISFGIGHLGNPNASIISTIIIAGAGVFLGLGYLLTGELAIPIGLHIAWNFFQGNVFGFPVSGTNAGASIISINQTGPEWITGGAFGPEAGIIGLIAIFLGCLLIIAWVRWHNHQVKLVISLAIYSRENQKRKPVLNPDESAPNITEMANGIDKPG
jgi:membrane protease YdiL (CAAX protease family)